MEDEFNSYSPSLTGPASASEDIVPSDTIDLAFATRAIYVGGTGDIAVRMLSGDTVTLRNAQAGAVYAVRVCRVMVTGTTATGLVGLR